MFHTVLQAIPTNDYKVYLYFSDGKIKEFDASKIIGKGVFAKLEDKEIFRNCCTVLNDTLAWDLSGKHDPYDCLDLDAEALYESCPDVNESIIPNIVG